MWISLLALIWLTHAEQVQSPPPPEDPPCATLFWVNSAYDPTPSQYGLNSANNWFRLLRGTKSDFPVHLIQSPRFETFLRRLNLNQTSISNATKQELFSIRFLYEITQEWKRLSNSQRDGALGLELLKIMPVEPSDENAVVLWPFRGREALINLSAYNRLRLLRRLKEIYPPTSKESVKTSKTIEAAQKIADDMIFHYLQIHRDIGQFDNTPELPLISDQQLNSIGWQGGTSFYSDLIGTSNTVAFEVEATASKASLYNFHTFSSVVAFDLTRAAALRHGLMIPRLESLDQTGQFFKSWDPQILERVRLRNRLLLPSKVNSPEMLSLALGYREFQSLFTGPEIYDRLAPLRQSLSQYVMTVEDGEAFLREALTYYLATQAEPTEIIQWRSLNRRQLMFANHFVPWLGINFEVRVPLAVSSGEYSLRRLPRRD